MEIGDVVELHEGVLVLELMSSEKSPGNSRCGQETTKAIIALF